MRLDAWELCTLEELLRERLNGSDPGTAYADSVAALLKKVEEARPSGRKPARKKAA